MDPELGYDAGWDRVEDDHVLSEWHVGLDDERNEDHAGRHRSGRFARDRANDLTLAALQEPAAEPPTPRRGTTRLPTTGPTGAARTRPAAMDATLETRLRKNLNKEAKLRHIPKADLWAERQRRYEAGESVATITSLPPAPTASRASDDSPATAAPKRPTSASPHTALPADVETELRRYLNVERKRRKVPKEQLWAERVARYWSGEATAAIVTQPKLAKPAPKKARPAPKKAKPGAKPSKTAGRQRRSVPVQGRPLYQSPPRALPRCPSCGAPEVTCRC